MKNLTRKVLKPFFRNFFIRRLTSKINFWNNSVFQLLTNVSLSNNSTNYIDTIDGITIEYVPNTSVGSSLFFDRDFEKKEIEFLIDHSLNHEFPVVLDIGANIGWHSIRWASYRKDAIVYAFEPSPSTVPILRRNVHKNQLEKRIRIIEKAVSNVIENANFFECDDNAYSSLKDTGRKAIIDSVPVPVVTIDSIVEELNIKSISLIKIDVEGYETEVIEGALKSLNNFKPDLFVEIFGGKNTNKNPQETINLIQSLGYTTYVLIDGIPKAFESHSDKYYNYYFTFNSL